MSWAPALTLMCIGFSALCALAMVRPRKRNKRTGLPAPKPDDRDSIANFKRMHQP